MKPSLVSLGFWSVLLQWGRFGIAAIVFLLIASWLSLAEIGLFAMAAAPVRFLQVLHRVGIADSVVLAQNGSAKSRDTDALFLLSLLSGAVCALVLFLGAVVSAGWIQGQSSTFSLMSALALVPLFNAVGAVPEGLLRTRLQIKSLAIRVVSVQTVAASVAIISAYCGADEWALVLFMLTNAVLGALTAWVLARWFPGSMPGYDDFKRVSRHFVALSAQALLGNALQPMLQIAVGLWLGLHDAGAFQIAVRFMGMLDSLAVAPIRFLALPLVAAKGGLRGDLSGMVLKGMRLSGFVTAPVYFGAATISPFILTLFLGSSNAEASAPLFQIFCLFGFANASCVILIHSLIAAGQTHVSIWRAGAQLALTAVLVWPALEHSVMATAVASAVAAVLIACLVYVVAPRRLGIRPGQAIGATLVPASIGFAAACLVHIALISPLFDQFSDTAKLIGAITLGTLTYAVLLNALARSTISDIRNSLIKSRTVS